MVRAPKARLEPGGDPQDLTPWNSWFETAFGLLTMRVEERLHFSGPGFSFVHVAERLAVHPSLRLPMTKEEAIRQLAAIGIVLRQGPGEWHLCRKGNVDHFAAAETLDEAVAIGQQAGSLPPTLPPMGPVYRGVLTKAVQIRKHNTKLVKSGRWRRRFEGQTGSDGDNTFV